MVNKTTGNKLAADSLMGRVFEVSQGDLNADAEEDAYRLFRLKVEDVSGKICLTNFNGMRLTTDKLRSICKKWHTLIETFVDIKTAEGYVLRVFAIAFTKKSDGQIKKTAYAQSSQVRAIRKRINDLLEKEMTGQDLNSLIKALMSAQYGREIEKQCQSIFPLQNALVFKIKTLRSPKIDVARLMEMHGGAATVAQRAQELGAPVQDDDDEPAMDEDDE